MRRDHLRAILDLVGLLTSTTLFRSRHGLSSGREHLAEVARLTEICPCMTLLSTSGRRPSFQHDSLAFFCHRQLTAHAPKRSARPFRDVHFPESDVTHRTVSLRTAGGALRRAHKSSPATIPSNQGPATPRSPPSSSRYSHPPCFRKSSSPQRRSLPARPRTQRSRRSGSTASTMAAPASVSRSPTRPSRT
jgi:hypothetical protein